MNTTMPRAARLIAAGLFAAGTLALAVPARAAEGVDPAAVLKTYADIAEADYFDALTMAKDLQEKVDALAAQPSEAGLLAARQAWLASRPPYMQTEAYRFGNAIVDQWETKVNSWPLDEGLIDYVDASYGTDSDENALYTANVIANSKVTIGGDVIDASRITPELLRSLQEAGGIEANVATGYHAIEFLLWGQDLHGTGPGAGDRPWTDYDQGAGCTHGNCDRRAQYLTVATDLLVSDLKEMAGDWAADGAARKAVSDGDPRAGLSKILTGLGSLSFGELAGQRMKLGLLLHDPEEEHDCFSDNTHNSHFYDIMGINNVYYGRYGRLDGTRVEGPSIADMVREADPALAADMEAKLATTVLAVAALKQRGETIEAYDQMIGEGNTAGNAVVQAVIDGLVAQTHVLERVITALDLPNVTIESDDSLSGGAGQVFQ